MLSMCWGETETAALGYYFYFYFRVYVYFRVGQEQPLQGPVF